MDLLTQLSVRFTDDNRVKDEEEDQSDSGEPLDIFNAIDDDHIKVIILCPCC